MSKEREISDWFQDDERLDGDEKSIKQVLAKTRSDTGKKDTIDLVFVKIWAAMMVLLAPLFVNATRRQSSMAKLATNEEISAGKEAERKTTDGDLT